MARTEKTKPGYAARAAKAASTAQVEHNPLNGTRPVTDPYWKLPSISKENHVATKGDKKSKKAKKEPSPELVSESSSNDEESSASSASSDEQSEVENTKPATKTNGIRANSGSKAEVPAKEESSESSESSASSDEEEEVTAPSSEPAKAVIAKGESSEGNEESGSEEDSDESESDEEPAAPGAVDSKELQGKLNKVVSNQASSDEDSDDEDESESGSDGESSASSDESGSEKEKAPAPNKRKAEAEAAPVVKKAKTEGTEGEAEATGHLFVGNLSWNVDEEWLVAEFEKFGELSGARVMSDKNTGRSRGFGYVDFVNVEDAVKATEAMNGTELDGRPLNVNNANSRPTADRSQQRQKSFGDATSPPSETLYVANIAFGTSEDVIGEAFGQYGDVTSVRLPTDMETGQMKGYGYVQFGTVNDAVTAFEAMKGTMIAGRPVRLDYATPKPDRGDGGGRGGRGGGRGGRGGFDRGGRGGGRGRGGFDRGGRGGGRGGRGGSTNRGGFGDFQGQKKTFG